MVQWSSMEHCENAHIDTLYLYFRYPLLLDRLYRVTPPTVPSLKDIVVAKKMIEETLAHINSVNLKGSILYLCRILGCYQ